MSSKTKKPIIAITGSKKKSFVGHVGACCAYVLVYSLGGAPKPVSEKNDLEFDGLILMGGKDIHPDHYGGKVKENYPYFLDRDELEFSMLQKAVKDKKPVLGICRGAQLVNIHFGGSLFLDVRQVYEKNKYPTNFFAQTFYRKRIVLKKESLISALARCKYCKSVNSLHTQAVDKLGEGLDVTAEEMNGVVQAIEHKELPILGVQFHPELLFYRSFPRSIFKWLIKKAAS